MPTHEYHQTSDGKMKMRKVKPMSMKGMEVPKNEKMYPTLHLDFDTLPEAKDWKVGENYKVTLELKQTGMDMHDSIHGGKRGGASFDIHGVKVI